mmetsp:Transcript_12842/g.40383  ORF Transcript_12842/g.40383 Transcript_12842/m.40383 type:complete len:287 (+) Transcript_12842:271-1131(+)
MLISSAAMLPALAPQSRRPLARLAAPSHVTAAHRACQSIRLPIARFELSIMPARGTNERLARCCARRRGAASVSPSSRRAFTRQPLVPTPDAAQKSRTRSAHTAAAPSAAGPSPAAAAVAFASTPSQTGLAHGLSGECSSNGHARRRRRAAATEAHSSASWAACTAQCASTTASHARASRAPDASEASYPSQTVLPHGEVDTSASQPHGRAPRSSAAVDEFGPPFHSAACSALVYAQRLATSRTSVRPVEKALESNTLASCCSTEYAAAWSFKEEQYATMTARYAT